MKNRLSYKFLLVYLLFALASFALLAVFGERLFVSAARRSAAEELYKQAVTLASRQSSSYTSTKRLSYDELAAFSDANGYRVLVLNTENTVIYDTGSGLSGFAVSAFNPAESNENYRIGDFYGCFRTEMISTFAPISAGTSRYGYLTLHMRASVAAGRANSFMREIYVLFAVILLLSLLLLAALHFWVVRPLHAITEGAQEFAQGNLSYRIPAGSADELGYLADSLNDMAVQLQRADHAQREFIANVSHDFRSPLTSIKGYLEAMVDGVIPEDSRDKYMNIIIGETERLTNLTQSMLSLNSLDEARRGLELSDFDIVDMIRHICETFGAVCQRRGITFELIFSASSIFVRADYGRIQQALHNLIDNAIKFSYDEGTIRIRVQELGEKASVAVKDFGQGIAKEELGRIWTRFYKSDSSRGKDKKGTGLGLSITRDIITAHGETIDVTSTPGSGTEFIFRLPLAQEED